MISPGRGDGMRWCISDWRAHSTGIPTPLPGLGLFCADSGGWRHRLISGGPPGQFDQQPWCLCDAAVVASAVKALPVTATVTDDVQVRNVEFFVDGKRVETDGNFPSKVQ